MKVALLDQAIIVLNKSIVERDMIFSRRLDEREAAMERRHQENLQAGQELREQIQDLAKRIDGVVSMGIGRWWK